MKKVIMYKSQRGVATNTKEAISLIESFVNPAVKANLIVNDSCKEELNKIFADQTDTLEVTRTTNSGSNFIYIMDALGDNIEEHLQNVSNLKASLYHSLFMEKKGLYGVTVPFLTTGKKIIEYRTCVKAYSRMNAFRQAVELATEFYESQNIQLVCKPEICDLNVSIKFIQNESGRYC